MAQLKPSTDGMGSLVSGVYISSTSCCFLEEGEHIITPYILPHTLSHAHTHKNSPLSEVKHWTILTAGITAQSLRMWMRRGGGGRETGRKRRNDEGGEGVESQLLPALSGLVRKRGCWGEETRGGGKRVKNRKVGQVWLAALLSFTPNQALVWAWNVFVFQNIIIVSSDSSRGNPSSLIRR